MPGLGLGVGGRPELRAFGGQGPGIDVDDDRGAIVIGVGRKPARAQLHEGVSPSDFGWGSPRAGFDIVGTIGHVLGETREREVDRGTLVGRQLRLDADMQTVGGGPAAKPTIPLGLRHLVTAAAPLELGPAPDRPGGTLARPGDESLLGLGGGEPAELDHVVDAEPARRQRLRDERQRRKVAAGLDPSGRLPHGDAVADRDPVTHVFGTLIAPGFAAVGLGEQRQQFEMGAAERRPYGVGSPQELTVGEHLRRCIRYLEGRRRLGLEHVTESDRVRPREP